MHWSYGIIIFNSRINRQKPSSDKLFLVSKSQEKIGIIKCNKINQWFMKKMKELKIDLWECI
jgi:hypothetical protein